MDVQHSWRDLMRWNNWAQRVIEDDNPQPPPHSTGHDTPDPTGAPAGRRYISGIPQRQVKVVSHLARLKLLLETSRDTRTLLFSLHLPTVWGVEVTWWTETESIKKRTSVNPTFQKPHILFSLNHLAEIVSLIAQGQTNPKRYLKKTRDKNSVVWASQQICFLY